MERRCDLCEWWGGPTHSSWTTTAECRAQRPQVDEHKRYKRIIREGGTEESLYTANRVWPRTFADDWCGEFEAKGECDSPREKPPKFKAVKDIEGRWKNVPVTNADAVDREKPPVLCECGHPKERHYPGGMCQALCACMFFRPKKPPEELVHESGEIELR